MPYRCSKCNKDFLLKSRFRGHLRRKTTCTTQTSLDAFKKLIDLTSDKLELTDPLHVHQNANYFQNRIQDLELFYNNLTDAEKTEAKALYDESFIKKMIPRTQTGQLPGL